MSCLWRGSDSSALTALHKHALTLGTALHSHPHTHTGHKRATWRPGPEAGLGAATWEARSWLKPPLKPRPLQPGHSCASRGPWPDTGSTGTPRPPPAEGDVSSSHVVCFQTPLPLCNPHPPLPLDKSSRNLRLFPPLAKLLFFFFQKRGLRLGEGEILIAIFPRSSVGGWQQPRSQLGPLLWIHQTPAPAPQPRRLEGLGKAVQQTLGGEHPRRGGWEPGRSLTWPTGARLDSLPAAQGSASGRAPLFFPVAWGQGVKELNQDD